MLTELKISHFAIIENQSIPFGAGLNVITGETGSGKSIILNALELILGGRSSTGYIRTGSEGLEVQAHFDLSNESPDLINSLPDIARAEELVVSRSLNSVGKGKVYINGNLGTVSLLNEIGSKLINICSQSQQIRLLEPRYHLELLDGFMNKRTILDQYKEKFFLWIEKRKDLLGLEASISERESRIVWLQETIAELEAVRLTPGIRKELESKVKRLSNSQRILDAVQDIQSMLSSDEGLHSQLVAVQGSLSDLQKIDNSIQPLSTLFHSAKLELVEFERELARYMTTIDLDDESLKALSERLSEVARLERKYKADDTGLMEILMRSKEELSLFSSADGIQGLRTEVESLRRGTLEKGKELTVQRTKASRELMKLVGLELSELNMVGAKLEVKIDECEPHADGIEKVEFLIAPNKGEIAKPLRMIASGGELSRIMLVLKKILRERSGVNVLVFDEVDTGISGGVARAVGQKLKSLSEQSQVICITHLAQVASYADKHLRVDKKSGARTFTTICELSYEERVDEIARMLSGFEVTKAARASAKELLTTAS